MDASLIAALIAAAVALTGSVISFFANRRAVRTEILKLEIELARRLTEKLYDKRLDVYPIAFEITDDLRGKYLFRSNTSNSREALKEIKNRLVEWHRKNGLILSEETIEAYKHLRWNLENVVESSDELTEEKLKPVWEGKISFRRAMRKDLNLLYAEEIQKGKIRDKTL
jgi:hypothetical protein